MYDLGDGVPKHSRTVSQIYGLRNKAFLESIGIKAKQIPVSAKHRFIYFLDKSWRSRLNVLVTHFPAAPHESKWKNKNEQ
jgi:hypothetical protein